MAQTDAKPAGAGDSGGAMTTRILLDCDPGNDDALGILVALGHADLDLVGVATGAGHLAADRTAQNGAIVMALAGRHVPVAAGAQIPLVRERMIAGVLDLDSGLDPERPDLAAVPLDPRHSADLIIDAVRADPGLALVTTGPFTNLALALRRAPAIAGDIGRLVSLAGAWGLGTKTAAAEWNILCDPEAASIVAGAGIPWTLIPFEAASKVGIDPTLVREAEAIGGPIGGFTGELLRSLVSTFRPGRFSPAFMPLNDPLAPLLAANPALAETAPAHVAIELAGRWTYGRTVIDFAMRNAPANAEIALDFDSARTHQDFIAAISRLAASLVQTEPTA
jgi:inosine-uridine nucleoside N-ribohydrolase